MSKKCLRLKCTECKRLLQAESFNHTATVLHGVDRLICLTCKRYCVHCGQLQPLSMFGDQAPAQHSVDLSAAWCSHCLAKRHAAQSNVYYRYPVLKYRACPFPVERYRDAIEREGLEDEEANASSTGSASGSGDECNDGVSAGPLNTGRPMR